MSEAASPVPPMNLDAEESILGAMMLSERAIDAVSEIVRPSDFYRASHGTIYSAALALYQRGEPVDAITLVDELDRGGTLNGIGGRIRVNELAALVPAASSAAHYARIVRDAATLRGVVRAGQELARLGVEQGGLSAPEVVDRASQIVFDLSQDRAGVTDFVPLADAVKDSFDEITALHESGRKFTGTPSGYPDLDRLTSGYQAGNLIIVGARPSMGKTSCALCTVAHVALRLELPVALFSMEMSTREVVHRLMSMEARVEAQSIRTGSVAKDDWPRLIDASDRLSKAPVFIDDAGAPTMLEVRSKARRLKARHPNLALVVVDYLQLMTGDAENRVQEVSKISRGLKVLARELHVPILALSQLSRQVEQRHDKRPILSDLRESGCLLASTRVARADTGEHISIGELVLMQEQPLVWALNNRWRLVPCRATKAFPTGIRPVYRIRVASGTELVATGNHPFRTISGWTALSDLAVGDFVSVPRALPTPLETSEMDEDELVILAHMLGNGSFESGVRYTTPDEECRDLMAAATLRRFGVTANVKARGKVWEMWFPSPYHLTHGRHHPMQPWIKDYGLWLKRAQTKFVPAEVFRLSDDGIRLFLHHLWATDGSITKSRNARGNIARVYYSSSSRRLADDVRLLLLRVGITSRMKANRKTGYAVNWNVLISGKDNVERFLTTVGCFGRRGRIIPELLEWISTIKPNPNVDLVPQPIANTIRHAMSTSRVTQRSLAEQLGEGYCGSYLLGTASRPRRFSRDRLRRIGEIIGSQEIRDIATSDVFWDEVVEITCEGEQPTFDVTVEGEHNFVADGIIVHNSVEQDADLVILLYRDEYYHPEETDQAGIAEVHLAKQRNGPTGVVKLSFQKRYAKFGPLALPGQVGG